MQRIALVATTLALAMGLAACGGRTEGATGSDALTIYSSLSLHGMVRAQNVAVLAGARLALERAHHTVGRFRIRLVSLDDSRPQTSTWDPGQVAQNAREAAQDRSTIAYIGDFSSGASAVSIPVTNNPGILQVSPSNTAIGLTSGAPGSEKGEPDKYYPSSKRNYGRVVPNDIVQGAALAELMKQQRCRALTIFNDRSVYGAGLAINVARFARREGIAVGASLDIDPEASDYSAQAADVRSDCFLFSGVSGPEPSRLGVNDPAVQAIEDVVAADPGVRLFAGGGAGDGVANAAFVDPARGGLPPALARRVLITALPLDAAGYPPAARSVLRELARTGEPSAQLSSIYGLYGYEAMSVILDSIRRAGKNGDDRESVVNAFFHTRNRKSVLGTYSIDPNGDTSLAAYGVYSIANGKLSFKEIIRPRL